MSRERKIHKPLDVDFSTALGNIAAASNPKAELKVKHEEKVNFLYDFLYMIDQVTLHQRYYSSTIDKELSKNTLHIEIENAILESSLSFVRKINEFFGCRKEVGAHIYLPKWKPEWILSNDDSNLLNDRVMHISLREARDGKHDWTDFLKTYLPKIFAFFNKFYTNLKAEHPEYLTPVLIEIYDHRKEQFEHYLKYNLHLDSALMKEEGAYSKKGQK